MKIMEHGIFGHIKTKGKLTAAGGGCSLVATMGNTTEGRGLRGNCPQIFWVPKAQGFNHKRKGNASR